MMKVTLEMHLMHMNGDVFVLLTVAILTLHLLYIFSLQVVIFVVDAGDLVKAHQGTDNI